MTENQMALEDPTNSCPSYRATSAGETSDPHSPSQALAPALRLPAPSLPPRLPPFPPRRLGTGTLPRPTVLFSTDPSTGLPACEPTDRAPQTLSCATGGRWREGQRMRQPTLPRTHRGVGRVRSRSPVGAVMASNLQPDPFRCRNARPSLARARSAFSARRLHHRHHGSPVMAREWWRPIPMSPIPDRRPHGPACSSCL